MKPTQVRGWVLASYALGASILLLAPVSTVGAPTNLDKVAHVLLMGVLAALLWWNLQLSPWRRALLAVLGTVLYASAMELLQGLTPFRSPEFADVVAGGIGAVLAAAIAYTARHLRQQP